jgi:type IV pilus assembly protein PilF
MKPAAIFSRIACCTGVLALAACVHPTVPGRTPEAAASINVQLALEYMRLDKLAISREFIERALGQDPHNPNVQATAGLVYERLDDLPKAERAFESAARLGKKDPSIENMVAGFLCRTHKVAEGEKLFRKVAHDPLYLTPEVALVNAGVCVHSAGDNIGAERYFRDALRIHPNMPEAMLQLGSLLLERGEAAEAVLTVERYLAVNPPSADIYLLGVRAERKLGDETTASGYAQRLQAEFPASDQARQLQLGLSR